MSLVCVSMATGKVWFYDGTVQCFNNWQVFMVASCIIYVLSFPFMLTLGMKLLQENKISSVNFYVAALCHFLFSFIGPC